MLLNMPTAWPGSCSKAIVTLLLPVSAVVGSQPGFAGAQAVGVPAAAVGEAAPGCAPGEGGLAVDAALVADAAGAQAVRAMPPRTSTASKACSFLFIISPFLQNH
jgi:hypothetical protein